MYSGTSPHVLVDEYGDAVEVRILHPRARRHPVVDWAAFRSVHGFDRRPRDRVPGPLSCRLLGPPVCAGFLEKGLSGCQGRSYC